MNLDLFFLWSNGKNSLRSKKREIARKYKNDEIDYETMEMLMDSVTMRAKEVENKVVYRINKFILHKENKLYKDIFNLITEVYTDEIDKYYISFTK